MDRRPAWEFAERVQIKVAYSKYGVAAWLSRSRLADCCAMSSFRSPYASVAAAGLRRHGRNPVRAALDQQGPDDAGHLVGQGGGDQHARLAREHPRQPRACRSPTPTGPADHRAGTQDQQSPDGPLAHLRDGSELVLAPCRLLQRRQPKPGGEVPPGAETLRRRHQGGDRSRCDRADAGDRHEPPRDGVGLGTPGNLTIQLLDLLFQGVEHSDQHLQDPACALGYRRFRVFDQRDQAVDVRGTLRHHMAVLSQVPAQGVEALRPLPHQQVAGPEHNSVRLLGLVLHRHKAHPRPLRRFADRLSIRHIILLPLDEGLYVSGWDQPHRVAQLAKLPRPVVRPATSLQRHKTARLPREKLEHLGPHQALAEHHPAGRISPVRLKYPLRNIKPYRASLAHGRLTCGGYSTPPPWHIDAVGGRPHHQGDPTGQTPSKCRGDAAPTRWMPRLMVRIPAFAALAAAMIAALAACSPPSYVFFFEHKGAPSVVTSTGPSYYLAAAGKDSNPGTQAQPWKTINAISSHRPYPAGTQFLFKSGETFAGSLYIGFNYISSPSSSNPVIVSSYGTGKATISSTTDGIFIYNLTGVEIRNVNVIGGGYGVSNGRVILLGHDFPNTTISHIVIDNVDVSG